MPDIYKGDPDYGPVEDAHNYKPGCTCICTFNGVLDSIESSCPVLAEERRQAADKT